MILDESSILKNFKGKTKNMKNILDCLYADVCTTTPSPNDIHDLDKEKKELLRRIKKLEKEILSLKNKKIKRNI